jgi:Flp pilus assembly protein TadG
MNRRNRKGVVAVEMALILPILVALFLGAYATFDLMWTRSVLQTSGAIAATLIVQGVDDGTAQAEAQRTAAICGGNITISGAEAVATAERGGLYPTTTVVVRQPLTRFAP